MSPFGLSKVINRKFDSYFPVFLVRFILHFSFFIFRGVYTPIAIIVSPFGISKVINRKFDSYFPGFMVRFILHFSFFIFRGAYASIAIIVSPFGLSKVINRKFDSYFPGFHVKFILHFSFFIFRGAYASIAIIVSTSGLFGKGQRAEGISTLSTISTFSTFFNFTFYILHFTFSEGLTPPSLYLFRIVKLLQFKYIFPCLVNKNEHIFLGIKVLPLRILYYIRVLGSISICFRILEGQL